MRNILIFLLLTLSSSLVFAKAVESYVGKWAFNDLKPKQAKCFKITQGYLNSKKKLFQSCRKSRGGGYAQDLKEHPMSCANGNDGILITDTKSGCRKQLEAELANGD